MARFRGQRSAFGAPGFEPSWTDGDKDGVGAAFSVGSRVWFTIRRGIVTEVYHPTIDRPQLRDLEFLFADGNGVFLEEKRDMAYAVERLAPSQGYSITGHDRSRRLSITKEIITDPAKSCVLLHAKLDSSLKGLNTYLLCAPHLEGSGSANNAYVMEASGRQLLVAEKHNRWLALDASCGFRRLSCGYVGSSDGYTDVVQHHKMTFEFDEARNGNVALTGELNLTGTNQFTVALAFGETLPNAISTLFQTLGLPFEERRGLFMRQWQAAANGRKPLQKASGDQGHLFDASYNLLLAHEDKLYQGAYVASLSIPWGSARNDENGKGGYHLVWTRDTVEAALGLLAAGNAAAPLRVLIYLAARQEEDGGFPQNFWVNGDAFRNAMQLDEIAFPVLLAWRLNKLRLLAEFNPFVMVKRATDFLLHQGPVTGEERWEEASGYSPSTLAAVIAALICAAAFFRAEKDDETASFVESYADFLRRHLEEWTVTSKGSLVPGVTRHFVRLNPARPGEATRPGAVDAAMLSLVDQPPGSPATYPARDIVDAGFLQLTRYGVLDPNDPLIVDSLRVVDETLKVVIAPKGPCWRRYNHDGYGQRPDGGPFVKWGRGRPWPLLTGERGHYELAAGRDARPFIQAMERFSNAAGLLPEQIWDEDDRPEANMRRGGPTGSASPLLWAHSEYIRLLRSVHDRKVFDLIPEVAERYRGQPSRTKIEFWQPVHPITHARKGHTLRICAPQPFRLHWSQNGDPQWGDSDSRPTGVSGESLDIPAEKVDPRIEFTFFWKNRNAWDGRNYQVEVY
jgi:glucoamylase